MRNLPPLLHGGHYSLTVDEFREILGAYPGESRILVKVIGNLLTVVLVDFAGRHGGPAAEEVGT